MEQETLSSINTHACVSSYLFTKIDLDKCNLFSTIKRTHDNSFRQKKRLKKERWNRQLTLHHGKQSADFEEAAGVPVDGMWG